MDMPIVARVGMLIAGLMGAASGGCPRAAPSGPEAAVLDLLDHIRASRNKAAWAMLDEADRTQLRALDRGLAGAEGDLPKAPHDALDRLRFVVAHEPESVSLVSRPGRTVQVRATVRGGQSATFTVRRDEEGTWRVGLLESLRAIPGEPPAPLRPEE